MFGKLIKKIKKRVPISVNKLEHDINSNYLNKVVGIMTEMKTRLMNSEVEKNRLESEVQQLKTNMSKKIQVARQSFDLSGAWPRDGTDFGI